jgi:hypothetical protein
VQRDSGRVILGMSTHTPPTTANSNTRLGESVISIVDIFLAPMPARLRTKTAACYVCTLHLVSHMWHPHIFTAMTRNIRFD